MGQVATCLWFKSGEAEEAARFYTSLIAHSKLGRVLRMPEGIPGGSGQLNEVLSVEFTLDGQEYIALNGGADEELNTATSLYVPCDSQEEIDRLWNALLDGGKPIQCGWITDRFGLSWQIVPRCLSEMMGDPDSERSKRVLQAVFTMIKIDLASLQAAYDG